MYSRNWEFQWRPDPAKCLVANNVESSEDIYRHGTHLSIPERTNITNALNDINFLSMKETPKRMGEPRSF